MRSRTHLLRPPKQIVRLGVFPDDMVAESQPEDRAGEQCAQPLLAFDERQCGHALAVQIEQVKGNEHQVMGTTRVHGSLQTAERRHAIRISAHS